jgi:hypothetical protein
MKIKITYCCKNCGNQIHWCTALYRQGRCPSCAYKVKKLPKGKQHYNFKGGLPNCKTCGKPLKSYSSKQCRSCSQKSKIFSLETRQKISKANKGRKHSKAFKLKLSKLFQGKNAPNFGRKMPFEQRQKISKSLTGKKLSKKTRLKISNALKGKKLGKNNILYIHGNGYAPYPSEFKRIKPIIRKRDNFTCQRCGLKEKNHFRKLDIHHIDYNKDNCKKDNLITLCNLCNNKANFDKDYWFAYYTYIIKHFITKN